MKNNDSELIEKLIKRCKNRFEHGYTRAVVSFLNSNGVTREIARKVAMYFISKGYFANEYVNDDLWDRTEIRTYRLQNRFRKTMRDFKDRMITEADKNNNGLDHGYTS